MATIKIEIVAGANTYSRVKTISGPNLIRMLNAYKKLYGQIPSGPPDPVTGVPAPLRDRTDQEVALAWVDGLIAGTMDNVKRQEQSDAAIAASGAITDVPLT